MRRWPLQAATVGGDGDSDGDGDDREGFEKDKDEDEKENEEGGNVGTRGDKWVNRSKYAGNAERVGRTMRAMTTGEDTGKTEGRRRRANLPVALCYSSRCLPLLAAVRRDPLPATRRLCPFCPWFPTFCF